MEAVIEFLDKLATKGVKLSVDGGQLNCYAKKGVLTNEIRDGIVKYRSEILVLLDSRKQRQRAVADKNGSGRPKLFPLSAGEKGLYILQKLHPGMGAYNVPLCSRISSKIDTEILARAWNFVLEQFPILTARIIEQDGNFYHQLDDDCKTAVQQQIVDFTNDEELLSFLRKQARKSFDLNRGPLTRVQLFTQNNGKSFLLITVHHIIFDGSSALIVLKSFFEFYRQLSEGKPVRLSQEMPGYHEFVAWEEAMLASQEGFAHSSYWQQQLEGELPVVELLPDFTRSASPSFEGKTLVEGLPQELSRQVRGFAKLHSLPPSLIFLAVFQLLLQRYTGENDIIIGMPVMGRVTPKFAAEVGYFINIVPIRTYCEDQLKLSDFLRKVQGNMLDALYHSSYPFPLMLDKLKVNPAGKNPVFQVTYAYQSFVQQSFFTALPQQQGLEIENVAELTQEGEFDLDLEIFEYEASFSLHLKYNPELYAQQTIRRFIGHYRTLLKGISDNPELRLHEFPMITEQEKQHLLTVFNNTEADYPRDKCIHELFAEQVKRSPAQTAAVFNQQELSYQELYERSCDLALYLQRLGIGPDRVAGLYLERSLEMMVGIMGTVQAGGAYLPLDPDYPEERIGYMLHDSQAVVVLTQEKLRNRISGLLQGARLIVLDSEWAEISRGAAELKAKGVELRREVKPHHLSYVIYTSGSTGKPKGVLMEHRALVNRIHWMQKSYGLGARDVVLQKTPYSFDVSVWEFFWPVMAGARVVFAAPGGHKDVDYLEGLINRAGVTTLHYVPSMLHMFLENAQGRCSSVRQIFCSGEALDRRSVDSYRGKFPHAVLHNLYGPTEAAIDVTAYDCSQLNHAFVPIGAPIDNTQIYILDRQQRLQPVGVAGELHIAGDGLARGYLNRAELTEEKFVANPFREGSRMYKTGDLARWLEDGTIQYLGRIDTQVKVRGFRIELGEIEVRLNEYPGIEASAVIAQGQDANRQLIAFYRAKGSTAERLVQVSSEELRAHLLRSLPEYMVPAGFTSVAVIPLNASGKVDRRALARVGVKIGSGREYAKPRNSTERQLAEIWAKVLKQEAERIGIHDSFFEVGGHSLLATQLIAKIRSLMNVELPLKAVFEHTSIAQMAELIAGARKREIPPIRVVDRTQLKQLPLSFAQERLWFIHQLEPNSPGYNAAGALIFYGELNIDQLDQAFNMIIARHETLRTLFPSEEGQARQLILEQVDFRLERIDLSHEESGEVRDRKARVICQKEAQRPFDLACGPLLRGEVIKLAEQEHILMLNMHHIISDGWSTGILIKELGQILEAFRQGRAPELPPLPIQYIDYSVWQRAWLEESGTLKQQLSYWQKKLAGVPKSLDLTTDYPRPSMQSLAGAAHTFAVDRKLTDKLKELAENQGSTLYIVLLAAFKTLLYRYTGQDDICVGSPIANRQYEETEGLIGMFVNALALRSQIRGEETFAALLSQVKATCLEAYQHQDAPFEKVVEVARPQRNVAITPIFQTMVIMQNADMGTLGTLAEHIQSYPLESGVSKFDLTIAFVETAEGLAGSVEYSTALYKQQTIARMAAHFTHLCQAIISTPDARLYDLDYISNAEKQHLLTVFNNTEADYPRDKCIHELFAEQVKRSPAQTAAVFNQQELSYQELYERSCDLALYLQRLGIGPDRVAGLYLERSLEMMVGIMGTVQAGGAYLPLDPNYPEERIGYMLHDSQAVVVLTEEKLRNRISGLLQGARLIVLDSEWAEISRGAAELKAKGVELRREVKPHHLSYVIYTSGSTGKPKGVLMEHRALVNRIHWMQKSYGLGARDVVLQKTPYSFDVSVWEFFWPVMAGARVVFAAPGGHKDVDYLEGLINRAGVTTLHYVPSMLHMFLENAQGRCSSVRQIFCSGEALDRRSVDSYRGKFPHAVLHNLYGPTEAAIDVTAYDCSQLNHAFVPIGAPIDNTQIYILDRQQRLQPVGVAGELHIAGDGLARGYLNRAELTEEKFVANPFREGSRMYKTGDLARWLEDGTLQYLGRIDTQVKVRGFRIELGEIEVRLNEYPGIEASAVIAQGQDANRQLIAFYRAKGSTAERLVQVSSEELRAHLLRSLPEYMVPAGFTSVAVIPLNASGKVDRRALARVGVKIGSGREYAKPRNSTERQLAEIWAKVLKQEAERIGIHDSFFEVGGHSLLATQLIAKIRSLMNVELPLKAVFEHTSIAQMAELIAGARKREIPPIRVVDRTQLKQLPLSFAQERLWFIHQLEPNSPGYNAAGALIFYGELNIDQLDQAFNMIIARHETLRTLFPSEEGQARQLILEQVDFRLERIDLSHEGSGEVRDRKARVICQKEAQRPFDLAWTVV